MSELENSKPTKVERLAKALLEDRNRVEPVRRNVVACWSCGTSSVYRGRQGELNGNFCSMRCQEWFDAGNPPIRNTDNYDLTGWPVIAGPPEVKIGGDYYTEVFGRPPMPMRPGRDGFYIACGHCWKDFESTGRRCCSSECERAFKERRDNLAVMAEAGIEPSAKRTCQQCGAVIPKWRGGKRVPSNKRFCSSKCAQKARRAGEAILKPTA
jgi:hypothetical protein